MARIYAPNKGYTGVKAGVSFLNGEGETNDKWLIQWFKSKGYKIEQVYEKTIEAKEVEPTPKNENFEAMTVAELKKLAKDKNIPKYGKMKKGELIKALKG